MSLVQKKIYLLRLFESNLTSTTPNSKEEKRILERQIIRYLSTEQQLYIQNRKEKELLTMGEKIQSALNRIQNPDNCSNSRILVCKLEQNCGFGCVMHHVSYCLSIASGAGRTLIFEDEGNKWAYNVQWNEIFEQITNCSYLENVSIGMDVKTFILYFQVKPFLPIPLYAEPGQSDRIVFLDRRWDMCRVMKRELPHAPEVAPTEIKDFLLENHPNPPLWFLGQVLNHEIKLILKF
ncbi:unnamed protein product [Meloidogyne enterolobii]|uniref:Uncharacterized protein n=1 Tax=Meloidogyne enterolobii TaxID=390850 RepID=A0ACB0YAP7_MELEN